MSHFYEKLCDMYHTAPINQFYQPKLQLSEKKAEITMVVKPEFFHAVNALHGSVFFKMLDDASFFAAQSVVHDAFIVTSGFNMHFLRPITGGTVRSVGQLEYVSKSQLIANAWLYDEEGHEMAFGTGTFMRSRNKLPIEEV